MSKDLTKLLVDNKFKVDKKLAYGVYRERVISFLEKNSQYKVTISFNKQLSREVGQKISDKMRELKEKHRALQHAFTTNVSLELIIYKSADVNVEMVYVLDDALNVLDALHPSNIENCPICGQVLPSNAPFLKIKDSVIQAHDPCIEQMILASNKMGNELLFKFDKKTFWKSLLFAILCMMVMVGSICLASFYGLFNYVSAIAGWGVIILFKFVLAKLKIPFKKQQLITITIVSVITLVLSLYFGSILDIFKLVENATLLDVFKNYFDILKNSFEGYTKLLLVDVGIGFTLLVAALFLNYKQLFDSKNLIKKL